MVTEVKRRQEEIREGIKQFLINVRVGGYNQEYFDVDEATDTFIKDVLKGVVIKVDKELPNSSVARWEWFLSQAYPKIFDGSLDISAYYDELEDIRKVAVPAINYMVEAGYVATESLVEG